MGHSSLGNLLLAWSKEERALVSFERALAIKPRSCERLAQ